MAKVERLTNSTTGGPVFVDVKDGKILRITPMDLDESDGQSWTIEARGRTFTPPRRTTVMPYTAGHKSMIYSPKRVLTPLKRVDFDPNGERNCEKRGESGYEPISWDEALDIVCGEINRIKRTYGPGAMLTTCGSHHLWGNVGYRHSAYQRFSDLVGLVQAAHNPDSWEGWHWGGMHMWGYSHRLGIPEQYDLLEDALKHTEMIVFWSADPESTGGGIYSAFESTVRRFWLKELGVKMIFIDPYYNHTAGLIADKWFSPRLGTDVALGLGIAYTWLTEGTYNKEYVASRTVGFDEWKAYVLGESDGVPKTPEWAEGESRIPARDIRALAREWGAKKTMLASGSLGGWGGACRSATGNEWARTMIALAAMQGMGTPGSNIWGTSQGCPADESFLFPGYAEGGIGCDPDKSAAGFRWVYHMFAGKQGATRLTHDSTEGQMISRLRIPEALQHEKIEFRGKGFCGSSIESQLQKYEYPAPGYPYIHMYWRYGGSFFGTMTQTNRYVKSYRNPKLQFAVSQPIWIEGEAKFADIILPACTNFERWDISEFASCSGYIPDSYTQTNNRVFTLQKKCIEPLGREQVGLRDLRGCVRPAGRRRPLHHGRQGRVSVDQGILPGHRPAQVRELGEVREEGLFRAALPQRPQVHPGHALVRRGPGPRHSGLGPPSRRHRRAQRPPDRVRQDRVRVQQPHPLRSGGQPRSRASGAGSAVHPQLGGPSHHRVVRQVSAAAGLASPAVQLPHHGRRQGQLDERGQGPPGADRRSLLLGHAPQHAGRGRSRHQERRLDPGLQRPGIGHPGRSGHRAGAVRHRPLLRIVRRVRSDRRAG